MMDAFSPKSDVTGMMTSGHSDATPTGGSLVDMLSAPGATFSSPAGSDFYSDPGMPSLDDENWIRVPANWLDAMPADRYDNGEPDESGISAVNSDDNGLYRMFRNLSP